LGDRQLVYESYGLSDERLRPNPFPKSEGNRLVGEAWEGTRSRPTPTNAAHRCPVGARGDLSSPLLVRRGGASLRPEGDWKTLTRSNTRDLSRRRGGEGEVGRLPPQRAIIWRWRRNHGRKSLAKGIITDAARQLPSWMAPRTMPTAGSSGRATRMRLPHGCCFRRHHKD
jgi:hypothetical protein